MQITLESVLLTKREEIMRNYNSLTIEQLEDHLYHLRNVLVYDRFYMSDKAISKQWNAVNRVRDILNQRKKEEFSNDS